MELRQRFKQAYDPRTGFLFSWDGEFKFEGRRDVLPDGSVSAVVECCTPGEEGRVTQELAGCMFLSGWRGNCMAIRVGLQNDECYGALGMLRGRVATVRGSLESMSVSSMILKGCPVFLCGLAVKDSKKVAEFCRMFPHMKIYVCPLVDELAAFGALVLAVPEEQPRTVRMFIPNVERLDAECVEFDPKLDGDGYGRMADLVRKGMPVLNEMMSGPGISPFYGNVLTDGLLGSSVYVVRSQEVNAFFPGEPVAATMYAATCVPTRMKNTDQFSKVSGWGKDWVDVVVVSDMIPELPTFAGFYKVMSGRGFFGAAPAEEVTVLKNKAPVFRNDRAYRVKLDGMGKFNAEGTLRSKQNSS